MNALEKFQRFTISVLVIAVCFYGGYYFGKRGFLIEVKRNPPKVEITNQNPGDRKIDFTEFWNVWDMVSQDYLLRPVDSQKMLYGAISGMVAALDDPYTAYLPPKVNDVVNESLHGNYEGIGAELGIKDSQIIVISPIDGSPAKAAGVLPGDRILEIEGKSTFGVTVTEAVSIIRGTAGTKVTLTMQSDAKEPRKVEITRGVITLPSISWADKGDGTAYIRVSRFYGEDSNRDWNRIVSEVNVNMKELDALIIDLRDNPGGYMQTAVYMAEEFFNNKPVVYQESALGDQVPYEAKRVGTFQNVPAVFVLINEGSASASEILAAALRDNIGAKLIGSKSFGKGTIQTAQDFADGSGIHITIAKWLTPKKEWVHGKGLEPDIKVDMTSEDRTGGKDPQLDKAVELAKEI